MATNPTTEIPVDTVVDGKEVFALFNQVEARLKGIEKLMAGVGITAANSAKKFNSEIGSILRDFNRASGQLDKFERSLTKPLREANQLANKISGATAGRQVREDASRYGAETVRAGLTMERELANQRLLTAATKEEKEQALEALKIAERKLRVAEALVRAEQQVANAQARTYERGIASDGGPDRSLRLNALRKELRETVDIGAVEKRRADSSARLNTLLSERNLLSGKERVEQNARIREEIERNKLIDARLIKLRQQEAADSKAGPKVPPLFGANGLTGVFARTAAYGGAASVLFGAVNTARQGAEFAIQWEDALAKLGAIANATAPEMAELKTAIGEIGNESRFSLVQLTEMATKLAQAGVATSGMKEALKSVSTLAAASGSTPDESVDLVTAALGSFQLQGNETARIADLITTALNRTRLTVQQAALAIQYVGTTAYEQNITLEQLLATTAALSQAGIRSGSTIGTGFRQFLVDLQSPSEKLQAQFERLGITMAEVDVKTQGLPSVLETLQKKGFGAAQAYGSLETRAAAFYLVAKNNLPLMNELQLSFADQGAAIAAQERAMNSLSAQWQRFKNVIGEGFAGSAEEILTIAKNLLDQISDRMEQARKMAQEGKGTDWYNKDLSPYLERGLEVGLNWALPKSTNASEGGVGTWLRNLSRDANDATGRMQELETAMNRTSQASAQQRDTVGALDKEILRLITQKETLKGKTQLVTAETVNLMARFEGLSRHITGATGDINGLIGALESLRKQEAQTLIDNISAEAGALQARSLDARDSRNAAVRQIQGDSGLMSKLSPQERTALAGLGGPNGRVAADILLRAAERFQETNTGWAKLLTQAGANQQTIFSAQGKKNTLETERGLLLAGQTRFGSQLTHVLTEVSGSIDRLRSSSGADRTKLANTLNVTIGNAERNVNNMLGQNIKPNEKLFLQQALAELLSDRNQIKDILTPTKAENKAADAQAQMLTFGSPVRGTPHINSGTGMRASPGGIGSTNHQGVDIQGKAGDPVYAAADGVVSFAGPRGGYGNLVIIDHGMRTETRYGHLSVIHVTVGQEVARGTLIGRVGSTGNSTGPHLHYERRVRGKVDRNPLSGQAPGSLADASDKAQQLLDKEEQRADREAAARARLSVDTANRNLAEKLKDLKYATSETVFDSGVKAAETAFEDWAKKFREQAQAELDRNEATPAEIQARMEEVDAQIAQRRDELNQTIYDAILGNFQRVMEALEKAFERGLAPNQELLSQAEGRLQGLSRQSLQGKVPDYVQQLAQNRVGQLQERVALDRMQALPGYIASAQAELGRLQEKLAGLSQTDAQWENTNRLVQDQTERMRMLNVEYANLRAQFQAQELIPQTIGEGIRQAVDAYREAHNLTASWTDMINMNLTDAIGALHSSLEGLLMDLTSGTVGVKEAFRNMAGAILKYLQQLIVKMIAVKLLQMALNIFAPGSGSSVAGVTNVSDLGSIPAGTIGPYLYGGQVKALNGRYITRGVPNRDSVDAKIARGEFVVRKKAVDSVGVGFMERLNERGSSALQSLAPKIVMPPPAEQNMNVYVVAPEQRPTMGPNDVLVTIANDIYRGGPTKQLIKQVSQGG